MASNNFDLPPPTYDEAIEGSYLYDSSIPPAGEPAPCEPTAPSSAEVEAPTVTLIHSQPTEVPPVQTESPESDGANRFCPQGWLSFQTANF